MPDDIPIPRIVGNASQVVKRTGRLSVIEGEAVAQSMTPFQTLLLSIVSQLQSDVSRIFQRLDAQDVGTAAVRSEIGEVKTLQRTTNGKVIQNRTDIDEITRVQLLEKTRRVEDETTKAIAAQAVKDATSGRWSMPKPTKTQMWVFGGIITFIGCDRILTFLYNLWHWLKTL